MSGTEERLEGIQIQQGACIYCGQIYQMETTGTCTEEQLDRWATEKCDCGGAKAEKRRAKTEETAKTNIEKLFRENYPEAADIMWKSVNHIIENKIASITIDTGFGIKGKVSLTNKGMVKVEKTVSKKTSLEA